MNPSAITYKWTENSSGDQVWSLDERRWKLGVAAIHLVADKNKRNVSRWVIQGDVKVLSHSSLTNGFLKHVQMYVEIQCVRNKQTLHICYELLLKHSLKSFGEEFLIISLSSLQE